MRYSTEEKLEIIRLVDGSDVGAKRTLRQLGVCPSTFYKWYERYRRLGTEGLQPSGSPKRQTWNRIPQKTREQIVEIALDKESYSPRELAWHITDACGYYISESSVYRILKEYGLLTSPAHIITSASPEFKDKTSRPNQMWQTDFTYFKIVGWGWYYLSTVLDDYSRYIVAWELCSGMKSEDAQRTVTRALAHAVLPKGARPRLLSDNGSSYVAESFKEFLQAECMDSVHGRPMHPQTQGKIERYNRSLKNRILLENYYSPEELERAVAGFVHYYNFERYHESIGNLTPAQVYYEKGAAVLQRRQRTKDRTLRERRRNYYRQQGRRRLVQKE